MPHQFHEQLKPAELKNTSYGFFTTESGTSEGAYVIAGEKTRNVNLFSPFTRADLQKLKLPETATDMLETPHRIVSNLVACFAELSLRADFAHKFVMTSNYGAGGVRVLCAHNTEALVALKQLSLDELEKSGLHEDMQKELAKAKICVIKADALVFKGIPEEEILAGGASGDAHPIVLLDDKNKVCAYISGAHAALKGNVIEETIKTMIEAGAVAENIRLVIGPGLGKRSYEFGDNAAAYLGVPDDQVDRVNNPEKRLLDIHKIVRFMALCYLRPDQVLNMDLNTMGFDLYDAAGNRKASVDFVALNKEGPLFFSARREMMSKEGMTAENTGLHNTVGRHFAGMGVRG